MALLSFIFRGRRTTIGGIVIDATMSETHDSDSDVTLNPVEEGIAISDHVQVLPRILTIQGIISDTPTRFNLIDNATGLVSTTTSFFGESSRSQDAYAEFLKIRDNREPFDVVTGLQIYKNMILEKFSVTRTASTGRAISFNATLREVRVARTEQASLIPTRAEFIEFLAAKLRDLGKKVTNILPIESPDAIETAIATQSRANAAFDFAGGLF